MKFVGRFFSLFNAMIDFDYFVSKIYLYVSRISFAGFNITIYLLNFLIRHRGQGNKILGD